jgi:hypothetical protein
MKVWANSLKAVLMIIATTQLVSCASTPPVREIIYEDQMTQLQARSIQSRTFEMTDRIKAMRAVITTLQDLDFVIDQADSRLGIITATKLKSYHLHITVKVDDRSSGRILVRIQLSAGMYPLVEAVYQEFFTSLEKNIFLKGYYLPTPKSLVPTESTRNKQNS